MPYGQTAYPVGGGSLGREVGIIAAMNPAPRYKVGGLTIDWAAVPIVVTPYTINGSGKYMAAGDAVVRYGTCVCRVTATTNGFVIGSFVPYSANQANTTVTSGGTVLGVASLVLPASLAINPGDVLTVDTAGQQEQVLVASYNATTGVVTFAAGTTLSGTAFTGVTTKTHANGVAVVKTDDGRGTLRRGECFLMERSAYLKGDIFYDNGHGAIDGGNVFVARVASDWTYGVTTNPTKAQIETGMPGIDWTLD